MNLLEARIILKCRFGRRLQDIWKSFGGTYRYDYIAKVCSNLTKIGLMYKRKFKSPIDHKVVVYYIASKEGIKLAEMLIRTNKMRVTTTTKSLMEFVVT